MNELPLEVFFGQATSAEARVYARLDLDDATGALALSGTVRGPFCRYAQTLPATMPLRGFDPGGPPLAQAFVPDPCLWTPAAPYYYEVRVEIARGGESIATHERMLGFRPLAPSGRNLFLEGRRWVLRGGVIIEAMDGAEERLAEILAAWHDASCALVVSRPSDELCEAASRIGVLLVADSRAVREEELADELHRLARWPAVGMVLLPADARPDFARRRKPENLLLAEHFEPAQPLDLAAWADLAFCEDANVNALAARALGATVPVVAVRATSATQLDPTETRAACDRLQRDLSPWADLAGYVV